jgi:hypothetical protein
MSESGEHRGVRIVNCIRAGEASSISYSYRR